MRTMGLIAALSTVGNLFAVGCGGSSFSGNATGNTGGGGAADAGPALTQIPQLYAQAMCTALTNCSQIAATLVLGANDCSQLISSQITNESLPGIQSAVAAGTATYDPSAVEGCTSAVAAAGCSFADNPYIAACEAALSGNVAQGGACAVDEECQGDLYCKCPRTNN